MNCHQVRRILPAFAEDDLVPAERESVSDHLAGCPACRACLTLDRDLAVALATLAPQAEPAREHELQRRTRARIAERQRERHSAVLTRRFGRGMSAVLGLIAIGVMSILLVALGKPVLDRHTTATGIPMPPRHLFLAETATSPDRPIALYPVDPTTLVPLPGYPPLDFGHDFASALGPDGRTLAAFVTPTGGPPAARILHLVDLESGADRIPGVTVDGYPSVLTFSSDDRSLFWASPSVDASDFSRSSGLAIDRYDLVTGDLHQIATLPKNLVPWDARALPDGTLAIYGIPSDASNKATDAPHVLLVDTAAGQIKADLRLAGIKAGQYPEADATTGQPGFRMFWAGLAWDLPRARLYIAGPETNRVVVVDLARGKVVQSADVHPSASIIDRLLRWLVPSAAAKGEDSTQRFAALSPDGRRLYLAGSREGETWRSSGLDVVDPSDLSVIAHLDLPVSDLALSPDGQRLLLHLWWPATPENPERQALVILDTRRLVEEGRAAADSPFTLFGFSPDGQHAYISRNVQRPDHTWESRFSVVDLPTAKVVAERAASGIFVGVWRDGAWQQEQ